MQSTERQPKQDLDRETRIPERELRQILESRVSHIPKALQTPPPNLPHHDLGPWNIAIHSIRKTRC